jgi:hypothetical protein
VLAVALANVLSAPSRERSALGAALRARALSLFTADRVLDAYRRVYRELGASSAIPSVVPDQAAGADRRRPVQVAS